MIRAALALLASLCALGLVSADVVLASHGYGKGVSGFWTEAEHRTMVIFVDFPKTAATTAAATHPIRNLLINTRDNASTNNLEDYYAKISYGRLRVRVNFAVNLAQGSNGWFRMPQDPSKYSKSTTASSIQLIRDAITVADGLVNYRNYDSVIVVINKEAKAIGCGFARGIRFGAEHKSKSKLDAPTADGVTVKRGAEVCEDSTLATIAHEFAHVLGLPDMYEKEENATSRYMGGWDLMTGGSTFTCATSGTRGLAGWSRLKLGFVEKGDVAVVAGGESKSVKLDPLDAPSLSAGARRLIQFNNPLHPRKFLVVEVRRPQGYDANLPGTGVLISKVDETIGDGDGTVRIVPALAEAWGKPFDGALFKAPGEPAPARRTCDTSPGLSRWSSRFDEEVRGAGRRSWFPDISITEKRGSTYTVQVSGRVSGR